MVPNDIRAALKAEPFRPFEVRLNDGRSLRVPHPDFASLSPGKWDLIVWHQGGEGGYDFVDIGSITSLRYPARNGRQRRK